MAARWATLPALLVFVALGACAAKAPTALPSVAMSPPARILFFGNSFTYYNDSLHKHLRELIAASDPGLSQKARLRIATISGGRLAEHGATFKSIVTAEPWDIVVLQGHSLEAYNPETRPVFRQTAQGFDRIVRDVGARTALFMTWAYEGREEMTDVIANQYNGLGHDLDAMVVPVGLAFARTTREHPNIRLRHTDLKHPTLAGTYLAACVFYARIYDQTPVGNPYAAGLDANMARTLQQMAWDTVSSAGAASEPLTSVQ